jgi:hypothetical protein
MQIPVAGLDSRRQPGILSQVCVRVFLTDGFCFFSLRIVCCFAYISEVGFLNPFLLHLQLLRGWWWVLVGGGVNFYAALCLLLESVLLGLN